MPNINNTNLASFNYPITILDKIKKQQLPLLQHFITHRLLDETT